MVIHPRQGSEHHAEGARLLAVARRQRVDVDGAVQRHELMVSWYVGSRDDYSAGEFVRDLASRLADACS